MINLTSPSQRHYNWLMGRKAATRELEQLLIELALEAVHPSNLGALPPAPAVLLAKARQIGLVGPKEERILRGF